MLIRLLGQVTIESPTRTIAVSAPKRACLLAALSDRPGEPVEAGELIARIWGEEIPDSVTNILYGYVTRLRADLRDSGLTVHRDGGRGYVLDVPPERVDIHAVRAHADRARASADMAGALRYWRAAGELASGRPLAGIGGAWAEGFRAALLREHRDMHAERRAAELACGNHTAVVAELEALAEEERYTETTAGQLMLGLYRCGRPSDALTVFEILRRRMRAGSGGDPSAELRDLHVRILGQDPGLDLAATVTVRPGPVPRMLPTAPRGFTGRHAELSTLDAVGEGTVAVTGPGGIGKTALAVHWGHTRRDGFPGGQLYVNLRGFDRGEPVSAREAVGRLLRALGLIDDAVPARLDAASARFRELTAAARTLVVLDNARDAEQVRPLLPGPGSLAVVTSRQDLSALDGVRSIPVRPLRSGESHDLLRTVLGTDREAPPEALARLAELCGHLPLALRVAAANLVIRPELSPESYVDSFKGRDRLDLLAVDGDPVAAVVSTLEHSYRALDPAAGRLFARLGALPGDDFGRELLLELGGETAVDGLVAAHLLEEHRPERFRMHDLIRLYARRVSAEGPAEERFAAVEEFLDWHHRNHQELSAEEETNVILAVEAIPEHPRLWRGLRRLVNAFNHQRNTAAARHAVEWGLRQAEKAGDDEGVLRMRLLLATALNAAGELDRSIAMSRRIIPLAEASGPVDLASVKANLAVSTVNRDHRAAERVAGEAMELAVRVDEVRLLIPIAMTLSVARAALGRFGAGAAALIAVEERTRPRLNPAFRAWLKLGHASLLREQRRYEASLRACDEGLAILESADSARMEALLHLHRSGALRGLGRHREAHPVIRRALSLLEANGMNLTEVFHEHAALLSGLGRRDEALAVLDMAEATERSRPANIVGRITITRAITFHAGGDHKATADAAADAAEIFGSMNYLTRQVEALQLLAIARHELGDHDAARRSEEQAATIATAFDDPEVIRRPLAR